MLSLLLEYSSEAIHPLLFQNSKFLFSTISQLQGPQMMIYFQLISLIYNKTLFLEEQLWCLQEEVRNLNNFCASKCYVNHVKISEIGSKSKKRETIMVTVIIVIQDTSLVLAHQFCYTAIAFSRALVPHRYTISGFKHILYSLICTYHESY